MRQLVLGINMAGDEVAESRPVSRQADSGQSEAADRCRGEAFAQCFVSTLDRQSPLGNNNGVLDFKEVGMQALSDAPKPISVQGSPNEDLNKAFGSMAGFVGDHFMDIADSADTAAAKGLRPEHVNAYLNSERGSQQFNDWLKTDAGKAFADTDAGKGVVQDRAERGLGPKATEYKNEDYAQSLGFAMLPLMNKEGIKLSDLQSGNPVAMAKMAAVLSSQEGRNTVNDWLANSTKGQHFAQTPEGRDVADLFKNNRPPSPGQMQQFLSRFTR